MENRTHHNIKYLFIGGVPRSGTTMLQKILSNHSQILAGPEFDYIGSILDLYNKLKKGVFNERQQFYYNDAELINKFNQFIYSLFDKNLTDKIKYISEKTPSNALHFVDLLEFNPEYKLVFVVRDPRAIAASMKQVYQKSKKLGLEISLSNKITDYLKIMDSYYKSLKKALEYDSKRIQIIYYEDIIQNPTETINALMTFLNLPFNSDILNISEQNNVNKTINNKSTEAWYTENMKNKPINYGSIDKWKSVLSKMESDYIERYYLYRDNPFLNKYNFQKKKPLFDFSQSVLYKFYKP